MLKILKQIFGLIPFSLKKEAYPLLPIIDTAKEIKQSNSSTSVIEIADASLVTRQEEAKEMAWFARKNSLAEMFLDEPPSIINGDGTVYFREGDSRNTYDPSKPKYIEDYDGTIIKVGGYGVGNTYQAKKGHEIKVEILPGDDAETRRIKQMWIESQEKTAQYGGEFKLKEIPKAEVRTVAEHFDSKEARERRKDEVKNPPPEPVQVYQKYEFDRSYCMGLDCGGYDGTTFVYIIYKEGKVVATDTLRDVDEFNKTIEELAKTYSIEEKNIFREP